MENITIDKAFENQLASIKMEGYKFSADEIENVISMSQLTVTVEDASMIDEIKQEISRLKAE